MQTLDLNLASRPFRNNVLLWSAYSAAAALLLAFTVWNVQAYFDYGTRLDNLRQSVEAIDRKTDNLELRSQRATAGAAKFDLKYLTVQSDRANEVIERRALSWTRLFNQLEKVQPYGVRMASIRPVYLGDADRRTGGKDDPSLVGSVPVSVEGTSQNLEQFLEFERALLGDVHFARVEPERSSLTRNASEVLFELRFLYYPEGRPDVPGEAQAPVVPALAPAPPEAG